MSEKNREAQENGENLVRFECIKCGECCRRKGLIVTVTGRDVARLSSTLGMAAPDLLRALDFYVLPENGTAPKGLRDTPLLKTESGNAYMALRKMESGDCIFLKDNQCMIHPIRPFVCRTFPFVFRNVAGERKWGLSSMKDICPGLGEGSRVTEQELVELGIAALEDLAIYGEFAETWNETIAEPTAIGFLEAILSDVRFSI